MSNVYPWHFVGLFDVLGFEDRFQRLGLSGIAKLYDALINDIDSRNALMANLGNFLRMEDEAIWTAEGDAFIFNRLRGAYASDSLLLWSHAHFPEARGITDVERANRTADPALGWAYHVIPCDRFLEGCCELVCHSLEVGLPLRGALCMGPALLDETRKIFLGEPLIHAARAEKSQRIIGAALCPSFAQQVIPKRFSLAFNSQVKAGFERHFSGLLLDWPRHWRRTRLADVRSVLHRLDTKPEAAAYYENTYRFVDESVVLSDKFEDPASFSIRAVYPQFAFPEVCLNVRAVRSAARERRR